MSNVEIVIRLLTSVIITGLIGYERYRRNKDAGLTTHGLVGLGACVIAIIQDMSAFEVIEYANANKELISIYQYENQRIIAQVVTGVGFIGAGTIMKSNGHITGITTAATLWISAMIGIAIGVGEYELGIFTSIIVLVFIYIVRLVIKRNRKHLS